MRPNVTRNSLRCVTETRWFKWRKERKKHLRVKRVFFEQFVTTLSVQKPTSVTRTKAHKKMTRRRAHIKYVLFKHGTS